MATTNDNQAQPTTNEHENEFYCGICGWVPLADILTHGHPQEGK